MTTPTPHAATPLRLAVTGSTGLIGTAVCRELSVQGHRVYRVRRTRQAAGGEAHWNVQSGEIVFPGPVDVLVHLAGRSIAARWSAKVKREIWDSRVPATEKLAAFLSRQPADMRPRLWISTSAVGIYGNRGDELLTEQSAPAAPGAMFLADVCRAWEAATRPAQAAGVRVTHLRVGVVIAREGGALAKMFPPTKLGLGGPIGKGTQFIPWISLADISRLIAALATDPNPPPVVNAVGPSPVRQHEFIRTLGHILHRPTVFPMPSFIVKIAFGQMGKEALLASLRAVPTKLPAGFAFEHPTLADAIRAALALPQTSLPR